MYVITGATGNTGHAAVERLLAKGQKVRAIARSRERLQKLAARGAEVAVADLSDTAALTEALRGAEAAYVMIPPSLADPDPRGYARRIADSMVTAIERAGVKKVVSLSSIGADKPDGTGPVVGIHEFEQKLNAIPGVDALHLRAGYFMENTLAQAELIRRFGITGGPLDPDMPVPMIATRDIGQAAAEALAALDFHHGETRELLGQRDLTMTEATEILRRATGVAKLEYRRLPDAQVRSFFIQSGMSPQMVDSLLEMSAAINSGYMRALEQRSSRNTTPTSFETFVAEEFAPMYQAVPKAG